MGFLARKIDLKTPGAKTDPNAPQSSAMAKQVGGTHYKSMKIQHFTFCQVNRIPWGESAAIKYICRHREKNGKEDLLKAIHYLEMVIEQEYPDLLIKTQPDLPA